MIHCTETSSVHLAYSLAYSCSKTITALITVLPFITKNTLNGLKWPY